MFWYVSKLNFGEIALVSTFCPDNSISVNVSSNSKLSTFSVYCKIFAIHSKY